MTVRKLAPALHGDRQSGRGIGGCRLLAQAARLAVIEPGLGRPLGGGFDRGEQAEQRQQRSEQPERQIEGARREQQRAATQYFQDGAGLAALGLGEPRRPRDVVDTPALEQAVASSSVLRPGGSVSAISAAFRAEKAGALVRLAKDVGRITEKAGTRGALDTLKIAEGPKDVSRAARLAEAEGGKTRAILKILGRGAILLLGGAFDLTLWLLSALLALFGLLATIKSMTERATQAWLDHRKTRRLRKQLTAAKAEAKVAEAGKAEARVAIAAASA